MWVRSFAIGVIISSILHLISSKPFLHNALITLASSSSSSASSASTGDSFPARLTNIADYTKKAEKIQKLQSEKQLVEDVDDRDDTNERENNEVSPSLIQKKISNILAKIQLLSSFAASSQSTTEETDTESTETTTETTKSQVRIEFDKVTQKIQPQKLVATRTINGDPLRIKLEINEVGNSTEIEDNVEVDHQTMSRIAQLGVFFVELFGSLVGLAYGAVAHINNAIQGSNTPETAI